MFMSKKGLEEESRVGRELGTFGWKVSSGAINGFGKFIDICASSTGCVLMDCLLA